MSRETREPTKMTDPQLQARMLVLDRMNSYQQPVDFNQLEDVYIVWFAYTLKNWKAILSTTNNDNRIYEVTHNANTGSTYLDTYVKESNDEFHADHPIHQI